MTPLSSPLALPIAISTRLAAILDLENELLRTRKPREIASMQEEKSDLALKFSSEMETLRRSPELLDGAPHEERDELRVVSERFQAALRENQRLLFATKSVTEGIIRAVAHEVEKTNSEVTAYNDRAGMNGTPAHKPTSIALNQTI